MPPKSRFRRPAVVCVIVICLLFVDCAADLLRKMDRPQGGPSPMIGQTISHYRILEKLGGGGMGVVYKAEDTELGRFVALKFLPDEVAREPQALERFRREARAASALNHPNICTIHEIGKARRTDLHRNGVSGWRDSKASHRRKTNRERNLALAGHRNRGRIGRRASRESSIATSSQRTSSSPSAATPKSWISVWQRLVPERSSRPSLGAHDDGPTVDEQNLTSPGSTIGTVAYMSPEQARAKDMDARSDLFSFGAVLYEMATGTLPFRGGSSAVIFKAILDATPAPAVRLNPDTPVDLDRIMNKALEKDRNLRYQSAADLRTDLVRLKRDLDSGKSSPAAVVSSGALSGGVTSASSSSVAAAIESPSSRSRLYYCSQPLLLS